MSHMYDRHRVPGLLLLLAACTCSAALAAVPRAPGGSLRQLGVSAGHWVYHGHFLGRRGAQPSAWTWHEDCRWADHRVFMVCSFSNDWAGRHVDSMVVDTYDPQDHSFWHYELFNSGSAAGKPFAARMRIEGATRVESWTSARHGKPLHQRIVYRFAAGGRVTVSFQQSREGSHWQTTASGTGERTGDPTGGAHASPRPPG
jgi:hypothetical protein